MDIEKRLKQVNLIFADACIRVSKEPPSEITTGFPEETRVQQRIRQLFPEFCKTQRFRGSLFEELFEQADDDLQFPGDFGVSDLLNFLEINAPEQGCSEFLEKMQTPSIIRAVEFELFFNIQPPCRAYGWLVNSISALKIAIDTRTIKNPRIRQLL